MILNQEILLVSPFTVILRLTELLKTVNFYQSIVRSLVNISLGFIVAMIVGILMAIFATYLYSKVDSCRFLYYSCANLGAICTTVNCDFLLDGFSDFL